MFLDPGKQKIYNLWRRTVQKTAKDLPLAQLEVLYDTIAACISINKDDFQNLINVKEFFICIYNFKLF